MLRCGKRAESRAQGRSVLITPARQGMLGNVVQSRPLRSRDRLGGHLFNGFVQFGGPDMFFSAIIFAAAMQAGGVPGEGPEADLTFVHLAAQGLTDPVDLSVEAQVPQSAPTKVAAVKNPSIGVGLDGVTDWSTQSPFLDVFKTSREWFGDLPGQWGGVDDDVVRAALGDDGWPLRLPVGAASISTLILTELPSEMTSAAGRYRLTYEGRGVIEVQGGSDLRYGPNEIWFDYAPNDGRMVKISINRTTADDPIRNISVVHQDHIDAFEQGAIFNPVWLGLISDMRLLRYMDWMRTNNSLQSEWADRPKRDDFSWGTNAGVPLDIMVELANQTGTDPWFTLPHLASDEYIHEFATYLRDNLDPDLKAHFELSNEVWNWQFEQAQWAHTQGRGLWPDNGSAWVEYYAGRASHMAQIVDQVFGDDADLRVVNVLSTQTGWLGLEDAILNAPHWVKAQPDDVAPFSYFDAYAITGYFDGALGRDDKPQVVRKWLAQSLEAAQVDAKAQGLTDKERADYIEQHKYDVAGDLAFRELRDGSVTGDPSGSLQDIFSMFAYHKKVADEYGLQLLMYEGGSHIVGVGEWVDDEELTAFFIWLNQHDRMGEAYSELLAGWRDAGGTLFNAFVDVGRHSKWGSWGSLEHVDDRSARWDALVDFNQANPGWWETRPDEAFIGAEE